MNPSALPACGKTRLPLRWELQPPRSEEELVLRLELLLDSPGRNSCALGARPL